jgi:hypothetical protein
MDGSDPHQLLHIGGTKVIIIYYSYRPKLIVLKSELHVAGRLSQVDVCNADSGNRSTRDDAEREFRLFVMQTYEELYAMEARKMSGKPSICIFCRLDIGILIDSEEQAHYFVNEVERTQTASLWSNRQNSQSPKVPARMLGNTFAQTLYEWLSSMQDPYSVG